MKIVKLVIKSQKMKMINNVMNVNMDFIKLVGLIIVSHQKKNIT